MGLIVTIYLAKKNLSSPLGGVNVAADSMGICNFVRNFHTVFCDGDAVVFCIPTSSESSYRFSSLPVFDVVMLEIMSILIGAAIFQWYLICISLKHIFHLLHFFFETS